MNHLVVDHIGKEIVTLHQGGGFAIVSRVETVVTRDIGNTLRETRLEDRHSYTEYMKEKTREEEKLSEGRQHRANKSRTRCYGLSAFTCTSSSISNEVAYLCGLSSPRRSPPGPGDR